GIYKNIRFYIFSPLACVNASLTYQLSQNYPSRRVSTITTMSAIFPKSETIVSQQSLGQAFLKACEGLGRVAPSPTHQ
ncbi:MAG: hypothetical protein LUD03_05025, partial [Firmicutes bacterium]|nr:hypothetical protein [Bacillota bacterium]